MWAITYFTIPRFVRSMPSRIARFLFREPSGRLAAAVEFAGALIFSSTYVYFGVLGESPSISAFFFAVGFALSGVAESRPADRRRTAGALRVAAILVLSGLIVVVVFAPELVGEGR